MRSNIRVRGVPITNWAPKVNRKKPQIARKMIAVLSVTANGPTQISGEERRKKSCREEKEEQTFNINEDKA